MYKFDLEATKPAIDKKSAKWLEKFQEKWAGNQAAERIMVDFTVYKNSYTKADFFCTLHGEFESIPNHLMSRGGCPKCVNSKNNITTESFIESAKKIHGSKYDYSITEYEGMKNPVIIICPEHGEFEVRASGHIHPAKGKDGQAYYAGCQKCSSSKRFAKQSKPGWEQVQEEMMIERRDPFSITEKGLPEVMDLFKQINEYATYFIQSEDMVPKQYRVSNRVPLTFMSRTTQLAIDILTAPISINKEILTQIKNKAEIMLCNLAEKFPVRQCEYVNKTEKLDAVKEPLWKVFEACATRLENDGKQVFVTRKSAGEFL